MGVVDTGNPFKDFLQMLCSDDIKVSEEEIGRSWIAVRGAGRRRLRRVRILTFATVASVAAAVAAVVIIMGDGYGKDASVPGDIEIYALNSKPDVMNRDIQLVMDDESVMTLGGKESNIDYASPGKIIVDQDTIINSADDFRPRYNQLVVPYGKRTRLRLSDGSLLYANSATRIVYPIDFGTGNREIYVEGEVYLEVAHDPDRPFIVLTSDMNVRVLGTRFNVFAYPGVEQNVVLVEGSVNVTGGKDSQIISPGQSVSVKDGGLSRPVEKELNSLVADKNVLLQNLRDYISAMYPQLTSFLKEKQLSEQEIDICNLYLIGLRGKEIGHYLNISRHYIISSDIRKKLGLTEHDTNIDLYLIHLRDQLHERKTSD